MPFNDNLPAEGTDPWYTPLVNAWAALTTFVNGLETTIAEKADAAELANYVPTARTVAGKPLDADVTLAKADVGLNNVNNTADLNKPVSSAQQAALDLKANTSELPNPADFATAAQGALAETSLQPTDLAGLVGFVVVSTGSEARPSGYGSVLWLDQRESGGATPVNMGPNDTLLVPTGLTPTAPTITTTALDGMTEGVAFSQTLEATGTTPITWSVTAGALPAGLTLVSGTGVLSGTPTAAGSYSFTVTATSSAGSDTQAYSGSVDPAGATPWVQRTVVQSPRNGTADHTASFAAATAGNLLLAVAYGPVTLTTPAGWTQQDSQVSDGGLYVWTKVAAAAEASLTSTANASDAPIIIAVYELPSTAAWVGALSGAPLGAAEANPDLVGLTGTNLVLAAKAGAVGGGNTYTSTEWSGAGTPVEDVDISEPQAATDGYGFSLAYVDDYAGTSWQPTGTVAADFNRFEGVTLAVTL